LVKATEVTAAWQKVMASLWRDSLHVTCGLTACTPGSAPGPTLGNEYGKTLLLSYYRHADPWWLGSRVVSVLDSGADAAATLFGNSARQTVHARRACVHQAAKLVAALVRFDVRS